MTVLPFWFPVHYPKEGSTVCPGRFLSCICLLGFRWVCLGRPQGQGLRASWSLGVSRSGRRGRWPPPSPPKRAGGKIADDKGTLDDRPWPAQLHLAPVHVSGRVIAAIFCQHEKIQISLLPQLQSRVFHLRLRTFRRTMPKNHRSQKSEAANKILPMDDTEKWLAWV